MILTLSCITQTYITYIDNITHVSISGQQKSNFIYDDDL